MYNFGQSINQNPSTTAISSAVVMAVAQTLTTSLGVFVVNGIVKTNSVAVVANDSVQVQLTTSAANATTVFAVISNSLNNELGYYLATTKSIIAHSLSTQVYFTTPQFLNRNSLISTSLITVAGIASDITVPVVIPNVYGAYILKNGVNSGQTTNAALNDTLQIAFTTPSYSSLAISIPIAVGNMNTWFSAVTRSITTQPTPFYLSPSVGCTPGTTYSTPSITISGLDADASIPVQTPTGSITKNGILVGTYTTVVNGDHLIFTALSPLNSKDSAFITITAGSYLTIWSITNKSSSTYVSDSYLGVQPINYPVTTLNTDISLKYLNGTTTGYISLATPTNTIVSGNDAIVLLNYSLATAQIVDSVTNKLVKNLTFAANSKPIASDYYPKASSGATSLVVALNGTNTIAVYDSDYNLSNTFTLPFSPDGMCVGLDNLVYVSNKASNVVQKYSITGSFVASLTIPSPTLLKCIDEVYIISASGGVYTPTSVTPLVASIYCTDLDVLNDQKVFLNVYDNSVLVYQLGILVQTIYLSFIPTAVTQASNGNIYVTDTYRSLYVINGNTITQYATGAMVVGLGCKNSIVYAIETLKNVNLAAFTVTSSEPTLTYTPSDIVNSALGISCTSSTLTVSNVLRTNQINIEPYPGLSVSKNGTGIATSGGKIPVSNGDIIQFNVNSSQSYNTLEKINASIGASAYTLSITTAPDIIPETLTFNNLLNKAIDTVVSTEPMLIAGLSNGFTAVLNIVSSSPVYGFILNGTYVGTTASVVNGDLLAVSLTVEGLYGVQTDYTITASDYFNTTTTVGGVSVTSLLLDGPITWPVFATLTQDAAFKLIEYSASDAVISTPNFIEVGRTDRAVSNLKVGRVVHSPIPTSGVTRTPIKSDSPISFFNETTPLNEIRWALKETPIKPILTLYQNNRIHLVPYFISAVLQKAALEKAGLNTGLVFKNSIPTLNTLSTGAIAQHSSSKASVEGFGVYVNASQHTSAQNFGKALSITVYEATANYGDAPKATGYMYQPLVVLYEYNTQRPVDQIFEPRPIFVSPEYTLDNYVFSEYGYFIEPLVGLNIKAQEYYFTYGNLLDKTQFIEITVEGFEFTPKPYEIEANAATDSVKWVAHSTDQTFKVADYNLHPVAFAHFIHSALSTYSTAIANFIKVTDLVVFDPTPIACNLHGLFTSPSSLYADALFQGFTQDQVSIVDYKGCKLWTVPPVAETINCGSSGSLTPIAWDVNQGISPLFIGVTKDTGWVSGG